MLLGYFSFQFNMINMKLLTLRWVIPVLFIQHKIIKYVLISQNTTALAKEYMQVFRED
jgi:hypothetical protein